MTAVPAMAVCLVSAVVTNIPQAKASAVSCGSTKKGYVEDKEFQGGESGITTAGINCFKVKVTSCDFGKDSNGKAISLRPGRDQACGRNLDFKCFCRPGGQKRDVIIEVISKAKLIADGTKVSCGDIQKGYVAAGNLEVPEDSGIEKASLYCARNKSAYCLYVSASDIPAQSQVFAYYQQEPEPCGRNDAYLCFCNGSFGEVTLKVVPKDQPSTDT